MLAGSPSGRRPILRLRLTNFFYWEEDRERRPALRPLLYADGPVVAVDDLRHDRETQSDAGFLGRYKWIEDFFAHRIRDARAIVGEAHQNSFSIILYHSRYFNLQRAATLLHRFVSVLHQVYKGLLAQTLVERDQR